MRYWSLRHTTAVLSTRGRLAIALMTLACAAAFACSRGPSATSGEPQGITRLRTAAERGDVTAQHELGVRYFTGDGIAQDFGQAARWIRTAADSGLASAQSDLGELYKIGLGVRTDFTQSF